MTALVTLLFGTTALVSAAFGLIELRMLVRYIRYRREREAPRHRGANGAAHGNGAGLPTVTIQIPLYNERTAAERIVLAAAAQDYPRDRFDIQVLDDSTDETSEIVAQVAEELRDEGVAIRHLQREHRRGYKAGALAEGLRRSDAEFVAVFDADFVPPRGFLAAMLQEGARFADPDVAFAQARWAWGGRQRRRWFPAVLALLLERHFRIQKVVRSHHGHVTTFNGSGGVWRRSAIDDAGGWTSDTLTEDLDLSYRCALAGWRGLYVDDVEVVNELPHDMRAFKLQQRRWAKGTAQCLRKLSGRVLGAGDAVSDRWEEIFLLAGYAIHPLLFLSLLLWPWAVVGIDRTIFWVLQALMGVGMAAAAASLALTIRERDGTLGWRGVREAVASLAIGVGMMVNNTVAQVHGMLTSGGEFARTPKGGQPLGSSDGQEPLASSNGTSHEPFDGYETPLHWTFFAEILVIAYCVWGATFLLQRGEGLWAIAMVLWASTLGLVVQQQTLRPGR